MGGSGSQGGEDLVDHPGWPEDTLDEGEHVLPERIGLLEVIHKGSEDAQAVDRASTGRTALPELIVTSIG